jgi:hypothetical protein
MNSIFDDVSRAIASPVSRRKVFGMVGGTLGGAVMASFGLRAAVFGQETPNNKTQKCGPHQFQCGNICCDSVRVCVDGICCPPGHIKCAGKCCGGTCTNGKCCGKNSYYCGGTCCPNENVCCNGKCCTSPKAVCLHNKCCISGIVCNGVCCMSNQFCCKGKCVDKRLSPSTQC